MEKAKIFLNEFKKGGVYAYVLHDYSDICDSNSMFFLLESIGSGTI